MRRAFACSLMLFLCLAPSARGAPASVDSHKRIAFTLRGTDGKTHHLKEWRGKLVLLNFWASWCAPCQAEIHDLVAYQSMYGIAGLQIVGIGLDDEKKLRNVERSLEINYPVLLDNAPGSTLMSRLGNRAGVVPYTVLVSRSGHVIYAHAGVIDKEVFADDILPLLKQPDSP